MVNELALASVMPFLLVVGVIGLPGKAGSKLGRINHGCEDTSRLLIEGYNGMPKSLGVPFVNLGVPVKGFIALDLQIPLLWVSSTQIYDRSKRCMCTG